MGGMRHDYSGCYKMLREVAELTGLTVERAEFLMASTTYPFVRNILRLWVLETQEKQQRSSMPQDQR